MDPLTPRDRRPPESDVYWRRRLFALAAGLGVLGLLAWAVGGATSHQNATTTSMTSHSTTVTLPPISPSPSASPSLAGSASPTTSASGSPSPSATISPSASASHGQPSASPSPSASPQAKVNAKAKAAGHGTGNAVTPGGGCPVASTVVTLTANGSSYGSGVRPRFTLDVVSTASQPCTFNVGARYLTLVIKSGGVRVWGSGDCGASAAVSIAHLSRGVPYQRVISWDRMLSSPGCRMARTAAQPGTYTAAASEGTMRSGTVVFVLR
jgi:hypothetical protein